MFGGSFVNEPLLDDVDHLSHVDFLTSIMSTLFGNHPPALIRFCGGAYNDDRNEKRVHDMAVQALHASQVYFISHVLLLN